MRPNIRIDSFIIMPDHIHALFQIKHPAQGAHCVRPESNIVRPESNIVRPESNIVRPESNDARPKSNIVRPESNIVRPEHHVNQGTGIRGVGNRGAGNRGARSAPLCPPGRGAASLGSIIAGLKSCVTSKYRMFIKNPDIIIWQRNYHERIIWDDDGIWHVREYIRLNPRHWRKDDDYSEK